MREEQEFERLANYKNLGTQLSASNINNVGLIIFWSRDFICAPILTLTRSSGTPGVTIFFVPKVWTLKAASFKLDDGSEGLTLRRSGWCIDKPDSGTNSSRSSLPAKSRNGWRKFSCKSFWCSGFEYWLADTRETNLETHSARVISPMFSTLDVERLHN